MADTPQAANIERDPPPAGRVRLRGIHLLFISNALELEAQ